MIRFSIAFTIVYLLAAVTAFADPLSGRKQISLIDGAGEKLVIGEMTFTRENGVTSYKIDWRDAPFGNHFLSMRPFRCLEGPAKHWCYVDYPYDIHRQVSADDLTDLEYDLLVIHKGATEYGINMWNGVYYRLERDGERLIGQMHEMDMGILAVPPESGDLRPIKPKHLHETDPEGHWLPRVVIE
jgi:hypothetical protein